MSEHDLNAWQIGAGMATLRHHVNVLAWLLAELRWQTTPPEVREYDYAQIRDYVAVEETSPDG